MTTAKVGLDDYLAGGGDFSALATHSESLSVFESGILVDLDPDTYELRDGCIYWNKTTQDGTYAVRLTNFAARIIRDIIQDDGVETIRYFEIQATLNSREQAFLVPAAQFNNLNWVMESLGGSAIVEPGQGIRMRTSVAIQVLSDELIPQREYAHTGWRLVEGRQLYLHAGGGIGATGTSTDVAVRLGGNLAHYVLPAPPSGHDVVAAVRASLHLLDLLPFAVAVPLLAVTYLGPLRELMRGDEPDFVVWLHGPSGTFKTEQAVLCQSHYGDFARQTLPASFATTPNALERLLSSAKDALLVVDDFHPTSDRKEESAMLQVSSRLLRGVGNGSGRARMRADLSFRPEFRPRAVVLVTAERLPSGHSNAARMFPVAIKPGELSQANLTRAQSERHLFPLAMAGYLQYLAQDWESIADQLRSRFVELRNNANTTSAHAREPAQVAHLMISLETLTNFAASIGAINADAQQELLDRSWRVLLGHAADHSRDLAEETPVHRFLALLSDGFASKRAFVEGPQGGSPVAPERWGWELRTRTDTTGTEHEEAHHTPAATLLGVVDDHWLLLFPEVTFQFLQRAANEAGTTFPVELRTLLRRLNEEQLIATEATSGRLTPNVWVGGRTQRVIKLTRSVFDDLSPSPNGEEWEGGEGIAPFEAISRRNEPSDNGKVAEKTGKESTSSGKDLPPTQADLPILPNLPTSATKERPENRTSGGRKRWTG